MSRYYLNHIIEPYKLKRELKSEKIKILDCRWYLNEKTRGLKEFKLSRIPKAIFYDLEKNSDINSSLPHMMPNDKEFNKTIGMLGLFASDNVIIYDQIGFFCSSRIWFQLKVFGFQKVRILNGGFNAWIKNNYPVDNEISSKTKRTKYAQKKTKSKHKLDKTKIITKKNLEKELNKKNSILLLDARPNGRFKGLVAEPRKNLKSGNIEGSLNIPYEKISKTNGKFISYHKLKALFYNKAKLRKFAKIICTCGSGVTACNLIFSLDILGFKKYQLYDGSWAEWGKK